MPALKNHKHEAFARNVGIKGMSAAEAYREVFGSKGQTAEVNGCKLRAKCELRIAELREEAAARAKEKDFLTIEEKRAFCARVLRKKPSELSHDDPDCELVMTKMGPAVLLPSKAACLKLDNELAPENDGKGFEIIIRKL